MIKEIKKINTKPHCIGVILDGNRRWAKKNHKFIFQGHKVGYNKLKELIKWSKEAGIEYLIVYAFSTENWNRKKEEVDYLLNLARFVFGNSKESIRNEKIRVKCVGDIKRLPSDLQKNILETEKISRNYDGITLFVCVSYGGREEIIQAIKKLTEEKEKKEIAKLTEKDFSKYLYTSDMPDPDLIIRTSGEMRLSNFLPWQSVYSELFFVQDYWPDFSKNEFDKILFEYSNRVRRIGK